MQHLDELIKSVIKDHDLCYYLNEGFPDGTEPVSFVSGFTTKDGFPYVLIRIESSCGQAFGAGLSIGDAIAAYASDHGYHMVIGGLGDEQEGEHTWANPHGLTFTFIPYDHPDINKYGQ